MNTIKPTKPPDWAKMPLDVPVGSVLAAVRTSFPVSSIATPREQLVTRDKDRWSECVDDPEIADFDFVPITAEEIIVGVFDRKCSEIRELSETMLMSADNSLLDYVESADSKPFIFLIERNNIFGIVTLSDIQKHPVYCVIFALLISIEMQIMEFIRLKCGLDTDMWLGHLDKKSQGLIEGYWSRAQKYNVGLSRLSCASFTDELIAAQGLGLFSTIPNITGDLEKLRNLRNWVCHGMEIAPTPERALEVPVEVRTAMLIQRMLDEELKLVLT